MSLDFDRVVIGYVKCFESLRIFGQGPEYFVLGPAMRGENFLLVGRGVQENRGQLIPERKFPHFAVSLLGVRAISIRAGG